MQTQVTLNNQAQTYIAGLLANNTFTSVDEAVNSILNQCFEEETLLREEGFGSQAEMERFDAALQVGLEQIEQGKTKPLDWDRIERLEEELRTNKRQYRKNSGALPPLND